MLWENYQVIWYNEIIWTCVDWNIKFIISYHHHVEVLWSQLACSWPPYLSTTCPACAPGPDRPQSSLHRDWCPDCWWSRPAGPCGPPWCSWSRPPHSRSWASRPGSRWWRCLCSGGWPRLTPSGGPRYSGRIRGSSVPWEHQNIKHRQSYWGKYKDFPEVFWHHKRSDLVILKIPLL